MPGGLPWSRPGAGLGSLPGKTRHVQCRVGCRGPGQVRGWAVCRARPVMCSAGWAAGVQAWCGVGQSAGQDPSCVVPGGLLGSRPGAGRAVCWARPVMCSATWAAMVQARCGVSQSAGQDPSCAVPGGLPWSRPGAGLGSLPGKTRHVQCHVGCHGPGQVRGQPVCREKPVMCSATWAAMVQARCRVGQSAGQDPSCAVPRGLPWSRPGQTAGQDLSMCSATWAAMVQARCRVGQSAGQDPSCAVPRGLPWSRPGAGSASLPGNTRHVQCRVGCHGPGQVRGQPVCRARPIMCSAGWSRPGAGSGSLPGKTRHVNWKLLRMYAGFPGLTGRVRTVQGECDISGTEHMQDIWYLNIL